MGIIAAFASGAVLGLGLAAIVPLAKQALFDLFGIGKSIAPTEIFVEYTPYLVFGFFVSLGIAGILNSFVPQTNTAAVCSFLALVTVNVVASIRLKKFLAVKAMPTMSSQ